MNERHAEKVLIRKGGYFYRPNWCGYTASAAEAGQYDRGEANVHALRTEGVTVHEIDSFSSSQIEDKR